MSTTILFTDLKNRANAIEALCNDVSDLSLDDPYTVTVTKNMPTRSLLQNRLAHSWFAEVVRGLDGSYKTPYIFGFCKHHLLLPIKLTDISLNHETSMESDIIDTHCVRHQQIAGYTTLHEAKCDLAVKYVRSRNLPVAIFKLWLDAIVEYWAEKEIHLTCKTDEERYAYGITKRNKRGYVSA